MLVESLIIGASVIIGAGMVCKGLHRLCLVYWVVNGKPEIEIENGQPELKIKKEEGK